ncbi:hypothetical protein LTS08_003581 [Lithohypha guttulata]|nr:hypothetical protein LTS08_003581 [Lithohypha guttulata]
MVLSCGPRSILTSVAVLLSCLAPAAISQASDPESKRGIAYLGTRHSSDYNIFLSRQSPITWYYNWSPYPVGRPSSFRDIEFVPLLHNLETLSGDLNQLRNLPQSSTHLLTFNEPDHDVSGGGSDISPPDAARAYVEQINPLSIQAGGRWQISHPSTTGTGAGLNWLRAFNASCYELDPANGCRIDFIATHFYGDFPALASWLGTLNEYYSGTTPNPLPIWITELALPQQSAQATEVMMNTTLPYLDGLGYVGRYSWFGIFRRENANAWTGDGVSLLDNSGDLTRLGAEYLTTENVMFRAGMSADDRDAASEGWRTRTSVYVFVTVVVGLIGLLRL